MSKLPPVIDPKLPPGPCCVPSKDRAEQLAQSQMMSNERQRVNTGSIENMVKLDGGKFLMGTEDDEGFPADGEGPIREVHVDSFYIDTYAVTNGQFAEFVNATGYKTEAERFGWSFVFHLHVPKELVDTTVTGLNWWCKVSGADWAHPEGPDSSVAARQDYPATHISWTDAAAFAKWAGKRLPTEAEWEYASRGGLEQRKYPWGDELTPSGEHLCNIWQGEFPHVNTAEDGYVGTCPVGAFKPNGYGLYTITGNAWEWVHDWWSPSWHVTTTRVNPVGPPSGRAKVMKGGSYLCHKSYCNRYRVAARTSNTTDSATTNISFRCVRDL